MHKPTVHDIARVAGVSLATVDRVLNARPGVRQKTIDRVQEAIRDIGYVRDTHAANLARGRTYRFAFVLPAGQGQFLQELRGAIDEAARGPLGDRVALHQVQLPNDDPKAVANALRVLDADALDGVAIMAPETPEVAEQIARLSAAGVAVVTLVSDQPDAVRDHFVGIDNAAAGRTAGRLLGRFVGPGTGQILPVVTSLQSRDMVERLVGFQEVIAASFPNLDLMTPVEGLSDPDVTEQVTQAALAAHDGVVGLYSVGASIQAIGQVLAKRTGPRIACIDHELTQNARALLSAGVLDAVITQDTGHLARSALRVLRARVDGQAIDPRQEHIRIDIVIQENMARFDTD